MSKNIRMALLFLLLPLGYIVYSAYHIYTLNHPTTITDAGPGILSDTVTVTPYTITLDKSCTFPDCALGSDGTRYAVEEHKDTPPVYDFDLCYLGPKLTVKCEVVHDALIDRGYKRINQLTEEVNRLRIKLDSLQLPPHE